MLFLRYRLLVKCVLAYACFVVGAGMFFHNEVQAQATYDIITPLSFGLFAITRNDAAYDLSISENNVLSHDSEYVVSLPAPQSGEMFLEGLPGEVEVTVTFDDGSLRRVGGPLTPAFTITDFVTNQPSPAAFQTNVAGELTILYGATLRTSGSSQGYQSGTYAGDFDITIDF
jgi:hypothetical protein